MVATHKTVSTINRNRAAAIRIAAKSGKEAKGFFLAFYTVRNQRTTRSLQ